jgi:CheY-like chemotaxis protein
MQRASILLVDDDIDALTASSDLLRLLGYRVTAVTNPLDALQLLQTGDDFDVLLTDIVMPKMNGVQLSAEAVRIRQALCVIYVTGYAADVAMRDAPLRGEVLSKPWSVEEIEDAITRCPVR